MKKLLIGIFVAAIAFSTSAFTNAKNLPPLPDKRYYHVGNRYTTTIPDPDWFSCEETFEDRPCWILYEIPYPSTDNFDEIYIPSGGGLTPIFSPENGEWITL